MRRFRTESGDGVNWAGLVGGHPMSKKARTSGFTLVEVLVVVTIIGMLATVTTLAVVRHMDKAREASTRETIRVLKAALNIYYIDTGRYPAMLNGLLQDDGLQGWKGPYIEKEAQDGWGQPFRYATPAADTYEIRSAGKDDRFDTDDDVTSRNV